MGVRGHTGRTGRDMGVRARGWAGRVLAGTLLVTGALVLGTPAALAAGDPVPVPAPYGGALDAPDPGASFDDEQALELAMLGLGTVNGLAFAGVVIVSRFRGSSAEATRRALMARTSQGIPSGPRGTYRALGQAPR